MWEGSLALNMWFSHLELLYTYTSTAGKRAFTVVNSVSFEESSPFFNKQGEQIPVSYLVANHQISSYSSRSWLFGTLNNSSYCEIPYRLQNKCPAPFWTPGQATGRAAAVVSTVQSTTGRRKSQPTLDMPWMTEPFRACLRCHSVCKHTLRTCQTTWQNNPSECLMTHDILKEACASFQWWLHRNQLNKEKTCSKHDHRAFPKEL